jgi:hypothetical protein
MRSTKNRHAIDKLGRPGLDNLLTDGGDVVSLTHRPRSTFQNFSSFSGTHFY